MPDLADSSPAVDSQLVAGGKVYTRLGRNKTTSPAICFGSGLPTLVAPQGSIYLRSDGSSSSTRLYVASDSAGTWVAVTTAS